MRGDRVEAPSTGRPPGIEACRRQAERRTWKSGFVAGAWYIAEAVLDIGVSDSLAKRIEQGLVRLGQWRDDNDRAVPPGFIGKEPRRRASEKE